MTTFKNHYMKIFKLKVTNTYYAVLYINWLSLNFCFKKQCCLVGKRWSIVTDHHLLSLSMRKWPGSSRVQESPKITTRLPHIWRKSTSLCMLTPTSDNHRTTTTPVPDSLPSEPDVTSCIELAVQRIYRKWHRLCCKNMLWELQSNTKHTLLWCWHLVPEIKMI